MKYFAYGSNMSLARLRVRVPSAQRLGMYCLKNHDLAFHKRGKDGSAKCNAYFTDKEEHYIWGALFDIDVSEKSALDIAEGLGDGYNEKLVQVEGSDGNSVEATTYYATNIDSSLKPYSWYLNHVVIGAKEIGVPPDYLQKISFVEAIEDPDKERDRTERKIYS